MRTERMPPEWATKDDLDITKLPLFVVTEHEYTAYGYALNVSDSVFSYLNDLSLCALEKKLLYSSPSYSLVPSSRFRRKRSGYFSTCASASQDPRLILSSGSLKNKSSRVDEMLFPNRPLWAHVNHIHFCEMSLDNLGQDLENDEKDRTEGHNTKFMEMGYLSSSNA
ncbi:hypothetical protein M422DRAFT_43586 [Sphaerobolus stellatus SS14]|nr:hypothetical protein M422DRAFT_43586 [Sphaerobolus stellatus SS14]